MTQSDGRSGQRGSISGLITLTRNLSLITAASAKGAVFATASGTVDLAAARPDAVSTVMRVTFAVAVALLVVALMIAIQSRARTRMNRPC